MIEIIDFTDKLHEIDKFLGKIMVTKDYAVKLVLVRKAKRLIKEALDHYDKIIATFEEMCPREDES